MSFIVAISNEPEPGVSYYEAYRDERGRLMASRTGHKDWRRARAKPGTTWAAVSGPYLIVCSTAVLDLLDAADSVLSTWRDDRDITDAMHCLEDALGSIDVDHLQEAF